MMKGSDYIAKCLTAFGVERLFALSGGMITHLLDSLHNLGRPDLVNLHHEQAAAFAAEGWARMTGVPGVAAATSGPGAVNLLTGVGSCYFDSTPALFLTGQVNRHELKGDRPIRQLGFQECDVAAMARPVTKWAGQVDDPAGLPVLLPQALRETVTGRPGPILLDVPMDVQRAEVDPAWPRAVEPPAWPAQGDEFLDRLLRALALAKRPLAVVGGGLGCARAWGELRRFLEMTGLPAVNSLLAVDALPFDHPLRMGMLGTYGLRAANLAVGRADLLVVLGSRLDIRQTGSDTAAWRGPRTIFQVDVDPGEIGQRVPVDHGLAVDLRAFLGRAVELFGKLYPRGWDDWLAEVQGLKEAFPDVLELDGIKGLNPNQVLHVLSRRSGAAGAFVVDVGQNQLWAAQSLELSEGQRFLTSGGMGAMGFALPAAIGAALAARRPVVMVAGDGGFQVNLQELQTVHRLGLPLKMVILNNRCHGMVRQFQESYFESRHPGTYWGYSPPDFVAVAQAYGIKAGRAAEEAGLAAGLEALWADPEAPALLEIEIDTFTNLYPKIAFGRPMTEMEPQARPVSL